MKFVNLKFLFVFLLSAVMIFTLAACGGGEADGGYEEDGGAATEAPADGGEAPSGDVVPEFGFTNTGAEEICELYLSPAGQESWGDDQLGGATIPAGEKFTLKNIPAGSYDVKAIGCAGSEVVGQLDIQNP